MMMQLKACGSVIALQTMFPTIRKLCAVGALLLSFGGAVWAGPYCVPVTFIHSTNTALGESVFVVGSLPQLGNWSVTNAIKLVPTSCNGSTCTWSATIGIPEGTTFEYKFIKRQDCTNCLGNAANVTWEPGANRTNSTAAGPVAPFAGKSVFYYSGWTNVWLYYSNNLTGWTNQPMTPVKPGRGGIEQIWRADGVDRLGATNVQFGFFSVINGTNAYDNAGRPGVDYQTPLDACVVQDGQIYNYWPPAVVSANRVETLSNFTFTNLPSRTVRVYLPRGYNENTAKRYPVLYMHDGQNLFQGMAGLSGYSWNSDTNAANLIRFGRMRETIIVGVDSSSVGTTRIAEYKPPECGGNGDKYAALLILELKPYIDAHYRTLTDPDNTGTMGSSMGGLISTYLGWTFPDTFRKIGALSTAYWQCANTASNLLNSPKRPIRVYLDSGDIDQQNFSSDGVELTLQARDNLINNGYAFNLDLDHTIGYGQNHSEQWWCVRSPRCFLFLFPTSDEPNTVLDTVAPLRITGFQMMNNNFTVTWPSYRSRIYTVFGSTNLNPTNWSALTTTTAETRPWNYLTAPPTNGFRFFRVLEQAVPHWPN